jgi:transposase InsO family protein
VDAKKTAMSEASTPPGQVKKRGRPRKLNEKCPRVQKCAETIVVGPQKRYDMTLRPRKGAEKALTGRGSPSSFSSDKKSKGSFLSSKKTDGSSVSSGIKPVVTPKDKGIRPDKTRVQRIPPGNILIPGGNTRQLGQGEGQTSRDDGKDTVDCRSKGIPRSNAIPGVPNNSPGSEEERNDDGRWIRPTSPMEWRTAQEKDEILGELIKLKLKFDSRQPPKSVIEEQSAAIKQYCYREWKALAFIDNVLCRVERIQNQDDLPGDSSDNQSGDSDNDQGSREPQEPDAKVIQRIVPRAWREGIFEMMHASLLGGHLGFDKIYPLATQRFYWQGMAKDFRRLLKGCHSCAEQKTGPGRAHLSLSQELPQKVLERVSIDIAGPWEESDTGNKYILVIQDYFSKWVEIYCLPDHKAPTVAKCMLEYMCRFGVPDKVHSDQGAEFCSRLFKSLCDLFNIKKTRTTPYCPWGNGQVERFNRSIKGMIQHYTKPNCRDWDQYMMVVAASYRASKNASTGYSPNMLMFGRELNHPADLVYGTATGSTLDHDANDHVKSMEKQLRMVWRNTRQNLMRAAEIQQKSRTREEIDWQFKSGDVVYKILPRGAKISPRWVGPCRVVSVVSKWLIEIGHQHRRYIVNANNLKPFQEVKMGDLAP